MTVYVRKVFLLITHLKKYFLLKIFTLKLLQFLENLNFTLNFDALYRYFIPKFARKNESENGKIIL